MTHKSINTNIDVLFVAKLFVFCCCLFRFCVCTGQSHCSFERSLCVL